RACFDENILIDTHRGWAVMPANLRIVVAGAGRGVKFVTLVKMTVFSPGVVAHTDGVVFDLDQQGIVTGTGNRGEIELEGRKETFVRADVCTIDENVCLVINPLEADKQTAGCA